MPLFCVPHLFKFPRAGYMGRNIIFGHFGHVPLYGGIITHQLGITKGGGEPKMKTSVPRSQGSNFNPGLEYYWVCLFCIMPYVWPFAAMTNRFRHLV